MNHSKLFIPREDNSNVDALANLGSASRMVMKRVAPFSYQDEPVIEAPKLTKVISVPPSQDWCKEIIDNMERSVLLDNRVKARKVKLVLARYVMVLGELYRH